MTRDVEREKAFDLITIVDALKYYGVNDVLGEIRQMHPEIFHEMENYFKFREMDRKLGVLLGGP